MRFSIFVLCLALAATCYAHGWGKSKGSSWFKGWGGKSKDSSEEKGAGAGAGRRSGSHGSSSSEESSEENNGGNAGGGAGAGTGSRDDFVKGWWKRRHGRGHGPKCLSKLSDDKCAALINAFGQSDACADDFVAKACAGPCSVAAPAATTTTVPTTTTTACDNHIKALPYLKAFHESFNEPDAFYWDSWNCTLSHTTSYYSDGRVYEIVGRNRNVLNNNPEQCFCMRLFDGMPSIEHKCADVMPCEDPDSYMDYQYIA